MNDEKTRREPPSDEKTRRELLEKACELAFGKSNDAVKLAFLEGGELSALDGLDLKQLSGLHRLANGTVELKLLDRTKLIELLLEATEGQPAEGGDAGGFLGALNRAADKLGGDPDGAVDEA